MRHALDVFRLLGVIFLVWGGGAEIKQHIISTSISLKLGSCDPMLKKKFSYNMGTKMERILFVEDIMSQVLALDHVTLLVENGCLFIQTELSPQRLVVIKNEVFRIVDNLNTNSFELLIG